MNETKPTDSADTPSKESEPSAPEQTSPVEAKGALNAAKEKARAAVEGVKDLKQKLAKHDIKAELREAFAETKKNPASLWKKPETLRPGKDLAVVGLAASVVLLLLLLVTSGSFFGFVCFVLGLGALLFSALGLKTEGRKLAIGGSIVGILVVLCAIGQTFGSSDANETVATAASSGDFPVLVANKGKKTGRARTIIKNAPENASKLNSLNFFGFHTGMSFADFETLREHYDLTSDQLWGYYNVENGEVYRMGFTTKALNKIMNVPDNFKTVENHMLRYFGIVAWNNMREVIKGEVDSWFQSDGERLLFGDKDNVPRQYRTADGVVAKLFPKGWDQTKYEVFDILDTQRQKTAGPIWRRFNQKNRMRKRFQELVSQGVQVKMLQLPNDYEWLLREFDDGIWISAFPMTRDEFTWLFYDAAYEDLYRKIGGKEDNVKKDIKTNNGFANMFNALSPEIKGSIVRFREPFPEEMRKAFASGIVDEASYKKGYGETGNRAYPAVIVADEATSRQLNRPAMFVVHGGVVSIEADVWKRYESARGAMIRQGKGKAEIDAAGYGMDYKEWSRNRKAQAVREYVAEHDGIIDGGLPFIPDQKDPYYGANRKATAIPDLIASMIPITGRDFKMGKYEVTQAQWEAVMGRNPSASWNKGADNPVGNISWSDCQEFLKKLNNLSPVMESGLVFRLPTEEEWEYACRAGATGKYCKLADGTEITTETLGQVAWFEGNSGNHMHPVGQKKPNAFGLYDMHGNAQEWTSTAEKGTDQAVCGGSAGSRWDHCESSYRWRPDSFNRNSEQSLRLCASVKAD